MKPNELKALSDIDLAAMERTARKNAAWLQQLAAEAQRTSHWALREIRNRKKKLSN